MDRELIEEYRKGSSRALEELFENNKKLVCFVFERHFKLSGCPKDDMIQEGYLGLFEAIKRFDPEKEKLFNSYKAVWIKKKMFDFRRKFFKFPSDALPEGHLETPHIEGRYEKLRSIFFELDNLNGLDRMAKRRVSLAIEKMKPDKNRKEIKNGKHK